MKINVETKTKIPSSAKGVYLVLPPKKWEKSFSVALCPRVQRNLVKKAIDQKFIEPGTSTHFHLLSELSTEKKQYVLATYSTKKEKEEKALQKLCGRIVKWAKERKQKHIAIVLPKDAPFTWALSGAILGSYQFKIGDRSKDFTVERVTIVADTLPEKEHIDREIALSHAINFTRELVNLPPNYLPPSALEAKAKELAKGLRNPVKLKVLSEKQIQKLGMGCLYAVGKGSAEPPRVLVLEYFGGKKSDPPLAVVGKGVCFDAGGYNLKPTNHIEDMKQDMAGGAAVLGLFQYLKETRPKVNVVGVIGVVENLVSDRAFKPGDILTAMNGKTVEITNTDAEGRLVLADCLYYTAKNYKPAKMVDLATLTGACIVALGYEITAIMGNNAGLIKQFQRIAKETQEPLWELPITDHFREKVKAENADLQNWTAGVSAGSSMGGAFLEYFVEKTPWAHFDIAGTAYHGKYGDEVTPKGATGVLIRTLSAWIHEAESGV